jgi:hypothetical protein
MHRSSLNFFLFVATPVLVLASLHACKSEEVAGLCNPGDEIFCRCRGGDPGTKPCQEDGNTFGECGPCEERPTTGPGEQGSPASSSSSSGPGGGTPGEKPLFATCMDDSECESLTCRHNYCTKTCDKITDCPYPQSECVRYGDGDTICLAACETAVDCTPYGAPPSMCGFTNAIDTWWVTVCANWGAEHKVMPVDTDCVQFDHEACNLGYPNREIVCPTTGVCSKGCFVNDDCPVGKTCSAQGAFGQCQ